MLVLSIPLHHYLVGVEEFAIHIPSKLLVFRGQGEVERVGRQVHVCGRRFAWPLRGRKRRAKRPKSLLSRGRTLQICGLHDSMHPTFPLECWVLNSLKTHQLGIIHQTLLRLSELLLCFLPTWDQ